MSRLSQVAEQLTSQGIGECAQRAAGAEDVDRIARSGVELYWLPDQYQDAVQALRDMGFEPEIESGQVPGYETARDSFSEGTATYLNYRKGTDQDFTFVIVPSVQKFGLNGSERKPGLVPRYNAKEPERYHLGFSKGDPYPEYLELIGDKDPVHDNGAIGTFTLAVVLEDAIDPTSPDKPLEEVNKGVVYISLRAEQQRKLVAAEAQEHAKHDRTMMAASIPQVIALEAVRRLRGKKALLGDRSNDITDRDTVRFIHYEERIVDVVDMDDPHGDSQEPSIPILHLRHLLSGDVDQTVYAGSGGVMRSLVVGQN